MSANVKLKLKSEADSQYRDAVSSSKRQVITSRSTGTYNGSAVKQVTVKVISNKGAAASAQLSLKPAYICEFENEETLRGGCVSLGQSVGWVHVLTIPLTNADKITAIIEKPSCISLKLRANGIQDTITKVGEEIVITNAYASSAGQLLIEFKINPALFNFDDPEGSIYTLANIRLYHQGVVKNQFRVQGRVEKDTSADYVYDPATNRYVSDTNGNYISAT